MPMTSVMENEKSCKSEDKPFLDPEENAPLDEEEKSVLAELTPLLEARLQQHPADKPSRSTLLRFVRGYSYEKPRTAKTKEYLQRHLEFRATFRPARFLATPPDFSEFLRCYRVFSHGTDRAGHTLRIVSLNKSDLGALAKKFSEEEIRVFSVAMTEQLIAETEARGQTASVTLYKVTTIVDFKNVGVFSGLFGLKKLVGMLAAVLENNYPEINHVSFLVRKSTVLGSILSLFLSFVSKQTKARIKNASGNKEGLRKELSVYIDPVVLPKQLGGDCVCDVCSVLDN